MNSEKLTVGVLFSDIQGFGKLTQHQLETYAKRIVPEIAKVINPLDSHWEEINTWGDGLMLVSNYAPSLADVALRLRDFFRNRPWHEDGIPDGLSIRVGLHCASVFRYGNAIKGPHSAGLEGPEPLDLYSTELALAARIEPVVPPNCVWVTEQFRTQVEPLRKTNMRFDRLGDVTLAKNAGARLLFHMRRLLEKPGSYQRCHDVEIFKWDDPEKRAVLILEGLNQCRKRDLVRFVAITARSLLLPELPPGRSIRQLPVPIALGRGVRFQGVLLNPRSREAEFRSQIESPNQPRRKRLLQQDAKVVAGVLDKYREADVQFGIKHRNLRLKYTATGLAFSLWLFPRFAVMEPYHFCKKRGTPHLCGFLQSKIPLEREEYRVLERHFNVLWSRGTPVWSILP